MKIEIPIWEKSNLTIQEAAAYFGIGMQKLRQLTAKEDCPYVLWVGSKCLMSHGKQGIKQDSIWNNIFKHSNRANADKFCYAVSNESSAQYQIILG